MTTLYLIEEYLNIYEEQVKKYGSMTILLMSVGAFYETYRTEDRGPNLTEISNITNYIISKKNKKIKTIDIKNPYFVGFPLYTLQKNIKILVDHGYTVIVIDQEVINTKMTRNITAIHTPGTYCDEITTPDNNYITTIYLEELNINIKEQLVGSYAAGIVITDLSTGKIMITETYSKTLDEKIVFDDIITIINAYRSKEYIITINDKHNKTIKTNTYNDIRECNFKLLSYLELTDKIIQFEQYDKLNKNILKPNFQQEILKKIYKITPHTINIIDELDLEKMHYGRIALMILFNYIDIHNKILKQNLQNPIIIEKQTNLYLGNNALFQLNIFNNDINNSNNLYHSKTQYKSLFDVINKTSTSIGRRFLKNTLANPLLNTIEITNRYKLIELFISNNSWQSIENYLIEIPDIERYIRKLSIQQITPSDLYNCITGITTSLSLIESLNVNLLQLCGITNEFINDIKQMIQYFNTYLIYDNLQLFTNFDILIPIFHKNIFPLIDNKYIEYETTKSFINTLCNVLNEILNTLLPKSKKSKKLDDDDENKIDTMIKVEQNEKEGYYLSMTKRRAEILEKYLQINNTITIYDTTIIYSQMQFKYADNGNTCKIIIPIIKNKSNELIDMQLLLTKLIKDEYINWLSNVYTTYSPILLKLIDIIAYIDFCKSGAKCAVQNRYFQPIINNQYNDKSYIDAKNLRHPICEKLIVDTVYIPTDIKLGLPTQESILLFGLNSSGKSTLQKSIGLNIILAQIGYYVASSNFIYYPYTSLMTRISSNDNLFKGQSSFTLEIDELRAIIKRANKNTLVIADEICKGTEHQSSIIIVLSILKMLYNKNCSFITATHLHEITTFSILQQLPAIKLFHLHIHYDELQNTLQYDRILKEGSGENFYGLNVAKCLINDNEFISITNDIKKEIVSSNLEFHKLSKYNSHLLVDKCQICNYQPKTITDRPLEIHHIEFQRNMDANGFMEIDGKQHIHKNHKSNLCVLCCSCHDKIDTNELIIYGYINTTHEMTLSYKIFDNIVETPKEDIDIEDIIKEKLKLKYTHKRIIDDLKSVATIYKIKKIISILKKD